jgi:AcrR family transcriptional regulator
MMAKAFRGPKAGSEPPSDRFDQILVAAAALIYERGYHATSLRDIAAAVDIKAASIYYHFSNKQELLVKIMSRTMDDLIDAAHDALMIQPHRRIS